MEVAPQYDATTNTAQIGAQVLFLELCLVAEFSGCAAQDRNSSLTAPCFSGGAASAR